MSDGFHVQAGTFSFPIIADLRRLHASCYLPTTEILEEPDSDVVSVLKNRVQLFGPVGEEVSEEAYGINTAADVDGWTWRGIAQTLNIQREVGLINIMKKFWVLLVSILVFVVVGLTQYKFRMDNSTEMYSKVAQDIISDWRSRSFTSLTNLTPIRSSLVYGEGVKLDQHQTDSLLKTVGAWFLAYSAGTESAYLGFRLPEDVEWEWTPKAMDDLSSYFARGTVFQSEELMDKWCQKYGHPDRIKSFIPFSKFINKKSPKELAEIRRIWIEINGPGVVSPKIPLTAIDQWKQIAFDSSGETWFGGYWTGYSLKDTQIQIYRTNSLPTPLDRRNFGADFKSRSFGVDAGFENLGIGPLHANSLIQWKLSYAGILNKTGNLLIADIKTLINQSPPESPRPMLLRLVFREDKLRWVPYEIVEGSIRDTHNRYAFW